MVDLHLYSKFSETVATIIQTDPNFKSQVENSIINKNLKRTLDLLEKKAIFIGCEWSLDDSDVRELAYELFINIFESSPLDDERKIKMASGINKKLQGLNFSLTVEQKENIIKSINENRVQNIASSPELTIPSSKSEKELLTIFKKIIQMSKRIKIDQVAKTMEISLDELNINLANWKVNLPIKIEFDEIIVDNSFDFNNSIDQMFIPWEQKERSKDGKVEGFDYNFD
jgi:hypothetical protein